MKHPHCTGADEAVLMTKTNTPVEEYTSCCGFRISSHVAPEPPSETPVAAETTKSAIQAAKVSHLGSKPLCPLDGPDNDASLQSSAVCGIDSIHAQQMASGTAGSKLPQELTAFIARADTCGVPLIYVGLGSMLGVLFQVWCHP